MRRAVAGERSGSRITPGLSGPASQAWETPLLLHAKAKIRTRLAGDVANTAGALASLSLRPAPAVAIPAALIVASV